MAVDMELVKAWALKGALYTLVGYIGFWVLFFIKYAVALKYFVFCKDKKWKSARPTEADLEGTPAGSKTLVFVRHGESTWNITFNKSKLPIFFIPRLLYSAMYELTLMVRCMRDSWFYDSPLSHEGIDQVYALRAFLASGDPAADSDRVTEAVLKAMRGSSADTRSLLVCSPLRRAMSTALMGFWDRLEDNPEEKILLLPSLLEVSFNPDTLCITPAHTQPVPSWIESAWEDVDMKAAYSDRIDVSQYTGNKPVSSNGQKRLRAFLDWVFSEDNDLYDTIIVAGGHSLWTRFFFREFLPEGADHTGANNKLVNAGVCAMTVEMREEFFGENITYNIVPDSIRTIYGGFKGTKSKAKAPSGGDGDKKAT